MQGKILCRLVVLTCALLFLPLPPHVAATERMRVTFLNPERSEVKTGFWPMFTAFMQTAAEQLDIDLEVLYSERDHRLTAEQAARVTARATPPDFLITGNEKRSAGVVIETAERANVPVFLVNNGFVERQDIKRYGRPREIFRQWIGELIPDNYAAGYRQAQILITRGLAQGLGARDTPLQLVAFAGTFATHASVERVRGMEAALAERRDQVTLRQTIPGDWSEDTAAHKAALFLLRRTRPPVNLMWAANDATAFGLIATAQAHDLRVGRDILIGGCGWDSEAIKAVREGRLATTVGGHFMDGAWALVLLHDYQRGKDFFGVPVRTEMLPIVKSNVAQYQPLVDPTRWKGLDFRRFSRVLNPELREYDFTPQNVLRQMH